MSRTNPDLKELNGIKIVTKKPANAKDFKYCTVSRERGVLPIKQGDDFYMYHSFELDHFYGWCTIKVTKI